MNYKRLYFFVFAICISLVVVEARSISPINMGLYKAANAKERYMVLYETHKYASENNMVVDYGGIDSIEIEIPNAAPSIPLNGSCDFKGVVISVLNCSHAHTLFHLKSDLQNVDVDPILFETGDFRKIKELKRKMSLLIISDNNPWGDKREGYDYSATRSDILLINKGRRINSIIRTYANEHSDPRCYYAKTDKKKKVIKNLTINRLIESTRITYCIKIENQNNILLSNIAISTPDNQLYGDSAISIKNCTKVTLEDVMINGTYSQKNHYGYGIYMDNVWDSRFVRLRGRANWGVFGTNNMNQVSMEDCDVNRFDIHSYGKDLYFNKCIFRDLYNQYSSVYGVIQYDNCKFVHSIPVLIEYSYNSYVPFDLKMNNCEFEASSQKCSIIEAGKLHDSVNNRPELSVKALPNIAINNLTVKVPSDLKQFNIIRYQNPSDILPEIDYISNILVNGLKFEYGQHPASLCLYVMEDDILTKQPVNIVFDNVDILPMADAVIKQATSKYYYPYSVYININKVKGPETRISFNGSRLNYNPHANAMYNIDYSRCTIGMIRYDSKMHGRRVYKQCKLYLNCNDDLSYYIDNNADYYDSDFLLCNQSYNIKFTGKNNDVNFINCRSNKVGSLFGEQYQTENILTKGAYKSNKYILD